jgi:hypothetical protein
MSLKQHQCGRCRKHVAKVYEVPKKTGAKRTYCERCIKAMNAKGANIAPLLTVNERSLVKAAASTQAANSNGSNRK